MFDLLLNNLNVEYLVLDKEDHVVANTFNKIRPSVVVDANLSNGKVKNVKVGPNHYQLGKIEADNFTIYFAQDITSVISKYVALERDCLTKLYLRGTALPLIDEYIASNRNSCESYSIIMGDIDFFKRVNDTYGHDAGDKLLQYVANTISNSFRSKYENEKNGNDSRSGIEKQKDIICRFGGEEFLILLKNISLEDTLARVDELRECFEATGFVTMSFGVVNVEGNDFLESQTDSVEDYRKSLIKMAGDSLYHSKNNGRNVVSYYSEDGIKTYCPSNKTYKKIVNQ